jgi:hypothetical protein
LTWVSEGKDFRRLRVTLKAGEVFEIAMLAHGTPPLVQTRLIAALANYHDFRHFGSRGALPRAMPKLPDGQISSVCFQGASPAPFEKIFLFSSDANHLLIEAIPCPMRGAYRDRHGRWARGAMDADALLTNGV